MSRYIEIWSESLTHITGYKEVPEDYQPKEGTEIWCSKKDYEDNKQKFSNEQGNKYHNNKVHSYLLLKERHKATEELVKTIKENHIIKTTRNDEKPEMWYYKEGIYVPEARTLVKEICGEILGEAYTTHLANEVIAKIEISTYIDEKEFFNQQNQFPYLIPVKNGLLNTKIKQMHPATPEVAFFNKINAEYVPGADCPKIKEFLKQILGSQEDYFVIQEWLGFCLLRDYKFEKALMLYGSHGRNGKSKLLELITRFMSPENISGVSLQDIEKDDFAIGALHNKLVNIAGDISNEAIKNTGKFKGLTGRDTLSANRKFKNRIDFINYAKMMFACNELPPVHTLSQSFWLRWLLIEFPYQFLPKREIEGLREEEREFVREQNPMVLDEITSQQELNGLLNFALEGLERLESNKDFSSTKLARQLSKQWLRLSNSVAAFVEDCVEEVYDSYLLKSDFLKEYQAYCKLHRAKMMSEKVIKITLKDMMGISESQPTLDDGSRVRVWNGLGWKK